jgi:nitrate reductase molybdenum cofactor assembly chaperone NarJ/NarW
MSAVRLTHAVASAVLGYPDESMLTLVPSLRDVVRKLPDPWGEPLDLVLSYLATDSSAAVHYVETFDLRRRCCLYLTYYTHGDTRRRGEALLRFRQVYQSAGLQPPDDELPDHLAVVLEFTAAGHPWDLLIEHRAGLELLWRALTDLGSPYAHAIDAVRSTLPPADADAVRRTAAEGPPVEQVGLVS